MKNCYLMSCHIHMRDFALICCQSSKFSLLFECIKQMTTFCHGHLQIFYLYRGHTGKEPQLHGTYTVVLRKVVRKKAHKLLHMLNTNEI